MSHKSSSAVSSNLHPPVGTLIDGGSLELVEVLGVGGYGVVYRAVDTRSPNPKSYAVKCLVAQPHQLNRQRQIHVREITLHQIASPHPNVITLHRVVEEYNRTYIILDYAPDHDLFTQILHNCRYLGDDVLIKHVFLQLLDAVDYCHSLGIYHRDLKPENVLCFDDGYRIAITDFGLATTDKLSQEFRTGSVYHMSPECQGGEFAPTGDYSPLFNDIWSLGIILLNLATGRNPWKSATPDDPTFRAYLRDPLGFLPTVLPISNELNDLLTRMLEVDWRERITLRELRHAIADVHSFYSDDVVFEGSMARCPWEAGMDIDSDEESSESTKAVSPAPKSESVVFQSHWSKESYPNSDIVFARNSGDSIDKDSSYGVPWSEFSSGRATWAFESPTSSISPRDRPSTPASPASLPDSSLPITPNSFDLAFANNTHPAPRKGLTIETNFLQSSRLHNPNASLPTSFSGGTSMMHTAVDDDPYASSFFFASAVSESKASLFMPVAMTASLSDNEMKELDSPVWASPVTEMSSPSIYSSDSFAGDSDMFFSRSPTPSPNITWSEDPQVQCLHPQPSQPSPSFYAMMTDVPPPSRPPLSLFTSRKSNSPSPKPKTTSLFSPIKFFPRASPPPTPPPPAPAAAFSPGRNNPAGHLAAPPRDQAPYATCFSPPWAGTPQAAPPPPTPQAHYNYGGGYCSPAEVTLQRPLPQDQRPSPFRSPRHWFMPGRFFAYAGAQ